MTEASGNPEFRALVLSRALSQIEKRFKPATKQKVTSDMVQKAVDEAIGGPTSADLANIILAPEEFCEKCGRCCKTCEPITVTDDDIKTIAFALGIKPDLVIANFIKPVKPHGLSLRTPCPFLKENLCSIYEARPRSCRTFPFAPMREEEAQGPITLAFYEYCRFTVNFVAHKTLGILLRMMIERDNPALAAAWKRHMDQLSEKATHLTQAEQIEFYMKQMENMRKQLK